MHNSLLKYYRSGFSLLLVGFCLLFTAICPAQNPDIKRTYHWYFGDKAGLDFTNNNPVPINNSAMEAPEGCASISDTCGDLLFYMSGDTIWNRNNQLMQNGTGLMGHKSSTQSSLIIPQPGNDSIYYVFTTDAMESPAQNGLRYSIVNMNLDGGFGAVIQKNVLLYAPASEKLAATYHANNTDIWILSCNNAYPYMYYAYLLSATGVNPAPVITGSALGAGDKATYTCMNFSHDGNILANNWHVGCCTACPGCMGDSLELLQFDNNTGVLSNEIFIAQPDSEMVYGLVFSPDDSKLYLSVLNAYCKLPLCWCHSKLYLS